MPISFENDIKPLFRNRDQNCMNSPTHRINLRSYAFMSDPASNAVYADHANARRVHRALLPDADPRMPTDGAYWTAAQIARFERWMAEGFAP